jgi:hypothetical protein
LEQFVRRIAGVRRLDGCAAVSIAHLIVGRTSLRRPRGMTELRI